MNDRLNRLRVAYASTFLGHTGQPHDNAKVVIEDLISHFELRREDTPRVDDGAIDPLAMARQVGRRQVVDHILSRLGFNPYTKD